MSVYDTALHRGEKQRWTPVIARGEGVCHEIVCVMPSRVIAPGAAWDLAHDRRVHTGVHRCTLACYLGPSHMRCNRREGGQEKHRKAKTSRRWAL